MRLAELVWPAGTRRAGQPIVVYGFAIRRPSGLLLMDTGVGEGNAEVDASYRPRRRSIQEALATIGNRLPDVTDIVVSHLHFDHCGQNRLFPGVPIWVQREEYEAARQPDYTCLEWVVFPGATYRFLDGDVDIASDLHLLHTPGHTPGHQALLVDTIEGSVLLAGQAAYTIAEYEGRDATDSTDETYLQSLRKLRALRPRRVYLAHDDQSSDVTTARR